MYTGKKALKTWGNKKKINLILLIAILLHTDTQ